MYTHSYCILFSHPTSVIRHASSFCHDLFIGVSVPWVGYWRAVCCSMLQFVARTLLTICKFCHNLFLGVPVPWVTWGIGDFAMKVLYT